MYKKKKGLNCTTNLAQNSNCVKNIQEFFLSKSNLIHVNSIVSGTKSKEVSIRREFNHKNRLRSVLVNSEHLPGVHVQDDPLPGDGPNHDDLSVWGEGGGLGLFSDIVAPHYTMGEGIPEMNHPEIQI